MPAAESGIEQWRVALPTERGTAQLEVHLGRQGLRSVSARAFGYIVCLD
jgi:hypothetical protein